MNEATNQIRHILVMKELKSKIRLRNVYKCYGCKRKHLIKKQFDIRATSGKPYGRCKVCRGKHNMKMYQKYRKTFKKNKIEKQKRKIADAKYKLQILIREAKALMKV